MTYSVPPTSAIAFERSCSRFVIRSFRCARRLGLRARPDAGVTMPAHPSSAPTAATMSSAAPPSLDEPAPTPASAESGPHRPGAHNSPVRHSAHYRYAIVANATATIPSGRSRWAWPAAPPIWARSPLIHSIVSRTTAPVRSGCPIGIESASILFAKASVWRNLDGVPAQKVVRKRSPAIDRTGTRKLVRGAFLDNKTHKPLSAAPVRPLSASAPLR